MRTRHAMHALPRAGQPKEIGETAALSFEAVCRQARGVPRSFKLAQFFAEFSPTLSVVGGGRFFLGLGAARSAFQKGDL